MKTRIILVRAQAGTRIAVVPANAETHRRRRPRAGGDLRLLDSRLRGNDEPEPDFSREAIQITVVPAQAGTHVGWIPAFA